MKRILPLGMLILFVCGLLLYGSWIATNREVQKQAPPIIATITVYTDLPTNISSVLATMYEKQTQVHVNLMPLTEEQMATKLEDKGNQEGDIILTSRENLYIGVHHNQFQPFMSEQTDLVNSELKDKDGLWVGIWYDPVVFVQNKVFANTAGRDLISWGSLVSPGPWKLVMPDFVATHGAANILYSFVEKHGEEQGIAYFEALKPHISQYSKFLATPVRLAALGESDMAIGNYSDAKQYAMRQYPLNIIFPIDGSPYYVTGVAILKNTSHTIEAEKFLTWLLSVNAANSLENSNFFFIFTNPEMKRVQDSLGHEPILFPTKGDYTAAGKEILLKKWITNVRF